MQYYSPEDPDLHVGDTMPWWHEGVFHFFWLLDRGHHAELGGLGGHQWAHSSSRDLVTWEQHPLAVPLGERGKDVDWTSICTGSVIEHEGTFYAFYATRLIAEDGARSEAVCLATGADCIHFEKSPENPILHPPKGFTPGAFRDPMVFRDDDGVFHMLVTAELATGHRFGRGCLAHLTSPDLKEWTNRGPFLATGFPDPAECPDWFRCGDWYYLTFLHHGQLRYRMSRKPLGPWRKPKVDTFDGPFNAAIKTAAFGEDRRLAVGFLRWNDGGRDDGGPRYAGNAVFREVIQLPDGELRTAFPPEMMPRQGESMPLRPTSLSGDMTVEGSSVRLVAESGCALADTGVEVGNGRITCTISASGPGVEFGIGVRCADGFHEGYEVRFRPAERSVLIRNVRKPMVMAEDGPMASLRGVEGLSGPFTVDLVLHDDIVDLCVNGERCLVARYPEWSRRKLMLFVNDGAVAFRDVAITPEVG